MCHMPFRILATHTYTSALFLRIGDGVACAAGHRGSERKSKPEIAGEDSVVKTKYNEWCRKNALNLLDQVVVQY